MSELLKSDQKKIELLKILADGKVYTYYHLSKIAKTNYETVKKEIDMAISCPKIPGPWQR